jgi:6-phosphogluconolactonase (cycloisomerase 2 family)
MRKLVGFIVCLTLLFALPAATQARPGQDTPGAVYTMTNDASGNEVLVYPRSARGALGVPVAYSTGGLGTGGGLGNQSGVVLTHDDRWLLVVNAGSDTISVFAVGPHEIELVGVTDSEGQHPVSLTVDRDLVYVLNAGGSVGGSDNIAGFQLDPSGELTYLEGSTRPLSGPSTAPAQVGFDPKGRVLVVTEKATNFVDTFVIGRDGLPTTLAPQVFVSPGQTPFGFDFGKRRQLFVSEANAPGGVPTPGGGSASSYRVHADGMLEVISGAVPTTESAACWLLVTNDGRYAYTTNTPSGSVSSFSVANDGTLTLIDGQSAEPGGGPIDMAFSNDGRNLYTLNSGGGTISVFRVRSDGSLVSASSDATVREGANGLAAR